MKITEGERERESTRLREGTRRTSAGGSFGPGDLVSSVMMSPSCYVSEKFS
jgi:hypothetical protein